TKGPVQLFENNHRAGRDRAPQTQRRCAMVDGRSICGITLLSIMHRCTSDSGPRGGNGSDDACRPGVTDGEAGTDCGTDGPTGQRLVFRRVLTGRDTPRGSGSAAGSLSLLLPEVRPA